MPSSCEQFISFTVSSELLGGYCIYINLLTCSHRGSKGDLRDMPRGTGESLPRSLLCLEEWLMAAIRGKSHAGCSGSHYDTRPQMEGWAGDLRKKGELAWRGKK